MALIEVLSALGAGGGIAAAFFGYLKTRRGAEVAERRHALTEQEQYRQAISDQFNLYATQLDAAAKRVDVELARADEAERRESREREMRIETERQRDELIRANEKLRDRIDAIEHSREKSTIELEALKSSTALLAESFEELLEKFSRLEAENAALRIELQRYAGAR